MPTLRERHERLIPQGTQVASKGRYRYCDGFGPQFIRYGEGCRVTGDDRKIYIDWTMGLGAVTLGHDNAPDMEAIAWPLPSEEEVILAELVERLIPSCEMVRFMKSGSDATSACVRLARAYTGRDPVLRCGYHGYHDWALNADYQSKKGIPQCVRDLTITFPYNDPDALESLVRKHDPACIIMELVSLTPPENYFLDEVRAICDEYDIVMIADEVITGFRMAPGGAQEVYAVKPDLTAAGKAMGNGAPISLVCGKRAIMQAWNDTHLSGTHFGEVGAMRAAIHNLQTMEAECFWSHQSDVGHSLIRGYTSSALAHNLQDRTRIKGLPHFTSLEWDDNLEGTLFQQELLRRGVLVATGQFVCLAHDDEAIEQTLAAYDAAMQIVAEARDEGKVEKRLECKPNQTVFRRS